MVLGLTFSMFLFADGQVWASESVEKRTKKLIHLECENIVQVQAGYSHALLLDKNGLVYTFGANSNG